jgi:hypothetical protein
VLAEFFKLNSPNLLNIRQYLDKYGGFIVRTTRTDYLTGDVTPRGSCLVLRECLPIGGDSIIKEVSVNSAYIVILEEYAPKEGGRGYEGNKV